MFQIFSFKFQKCPILNSKPTTALSKQYFIQKIKYLWDENMLNETCMSLTSHIVHTLCAVLE